jgi:hypothetical protein
MNLTLSPDNNFFLFELNGTTTWVPRLNGVPDLSRLSEPYRAEAQNALTEWLLAGNAIPVPVAPPIIPQANPMGFRSKLYGLTGTENNALYGVYAQTTAIAVTPATESAALTDSRNILDGSLWNEPFSKPAFAAAYIILKNFLTPEQIAICDAAIIEFNLS